jgi:hypothetical protein
MTHRVSTDNSIGDSTFELSRTIITRLVDDRGLKHLRRLRHRRQDAARPARESLGDDLSCIQQLGPGLEGHDHRRQSREGRGFDLVEERNPVQEILLQRNGDQLLDLRRGEAERFRLDFDLGELELGKDVDPSLA